MSCRSTPASSALTSYARAVSGLSDHETGAVFHRLRRDAAGAPPPAPGRADELLASAAARAATDRRLSPVRRASLLRRLATARDGVAAGRLPDGPTFEAQAQIVGRAEVLGGHKRRAEPPYADGGTLWLTGDRSRGRYDPDDELYFESVEADRAQSLVCPCCYGWVRLRVRDEAGGSADLDIDPGDVAWSRPAP